MPFSFNAVELCVVTINEKPWTRAREVCRALEYGKTTKAADILKHLCGRKNYAHKWQLTGFVSETKPLDWPIDSQKYDIYINEKGIYETVFPSQQPKTKDFRRHCRNVLFPHFQQELTNKIQKEHQQAITGHDNQIKVLKFTNEKHQQKTLGLNWWPHKKQARSSSWIFWQRVVLHQKE